MYPYCFFENKITKSDKPLIKINDISIIRGFAAFDFFRIYNGNPFCFDYHFERFENTAKEMGLKIPYSKTEILNILKDLILKNKEKNYHVRFVLTGGEIKNGLLPSKPIFFILFEKMKNLPKSIYTEGASLITDNHIRTLPTSKTSNYLNAVLLQNKKNAKKSIEILYLNNEKVLECSTSNIFIVKENILITPEKGILKGVTRKLILEIAKNNNIKVQKRDIKISELKNADEIFITATNKKVVPIIKIYGYKNSNNKIGPITKMFISEYNNLIK